MAKKKAKDSDPLGKLIVDGKQLPRKMGRIILGVLIVVLGLGLLTLGILKSKPAVLSIGLMVTGGALALAGIGTIRSGVGFLPIQFEIRKRGIRYQTPHRDLDVEWEEIDSVFVQMISTNVLLNFTGVSDTAEYIYKCSNYQPFQVRIKTKDDKHLSFTSWMLPPMTGRSVIHTLVEHLPTSAMAYQLFAVLPKISYD
jgi:hypothetical protein